MYDWSWFVDGQYSPSQSFGSPGALSTVTVIDVSSEVMCKDAGSLAHDATAASAFRRQPVIVRSARAAVGSTDINSATLNWAVEREHADSSSAAAPDTWGVAIDVPLKYSY